MRREAAEIFLEKNMFVISCGPASWPWRSEFGPSTQTVESLHDLATKHVRRLSICFDIRDRINGETALDYSLGLLDFASESPYDVNDHKCANQLPVWQKRHDHYAQFNLCLLEADFANWSSAAGCCKAFPCPGASLLFTWKNSFPRWIWVPNMDGKKYHDEVEHLHHCLIAHAEDEMCLFRLIVGDYEDVDLWPYTFEGQIPGVCYYCGEENGIDNGSYLDERSNMDDSDAADASDAT